MLGMTGMVGRWKITQSYQPGWVLGSGGRGKRAKGHLQISMHYFEVRMRTGGMG